MKIEKLVESLLRNGLDAESKSMSSNSFYLRLNGLAVRVSDHSNTSEMSGCALSLWANIIVSENDLKIIFRGGIEVVNPDDVFEELKKEEALLENREKEREYELNRNIAESFTEEKKIKGNSPLFEICPMVKNLIFTWNGFQFRSGLTPTGKRTCQLIEKV